MKKYFPLFFSLLCSPLLVTSAHAHCQIPCGIYDDANVLGALHTDYVTIEKSVAKLAELSKDAAANSISITRWTMNKEAHAQNIMEVVGAYFLAQRVKLPAADATEAEQKDYHAKVAICHSLIVHAMKCKQKSDTKSVEALHVALHKFIDTFSPEGAVKPKD